MLREGGGTYRIVVAQVLDALPFIGAWTVLTVRQVVHDIFTMARPVEEAFGSLYRHAPTLSA